MKIKTKLYLIFIIDLILLLILGNLLNFSSKKIVSSIKMLEISEETVQKLAVLNMLTQDYIIQPNERAKTQWQIVYNSLGDLINYNFLPDKKKVIRV